MAIKHGLDRAEFQVDPRLLRKGLLDQQYGELPITSEHVLALLGLPDLHKDPFDRILVAQAMAEGVMLLTADARLASNPGLIRRV